jgi:hypothetical protein
MRLNAPKNNTFYVSLVLALLGLIGSFVTIPFVSAYAFWFVVVGFAVLAAGNYFKGF